MTTLIAVYRSADGLHALVQANDKTYAITARPRLAACECGTEACAPYDDTELCEHVITAITATAPERRETP